MTRDKKASLARTLWAASEMLIERRGQNISMKEIARIAQCSTSTIYDAFTSKDDLAYQAILQDSKRVPIVVIPEDDQDAFASLLGYLERRAYFMNEQRNGGRVAAIMTLADHATDIGHQLHKTGFQLHKLVLVVEAAARTGDIREGNAKNMAYCLLSAVSFEPFIVNLMKKHSVDIADVVEQSVEPFTTEQGREQLQQFLTACRERQASADANVTVEPSWLRRDDNVAH